MAGPVPGWDTASAPELVAALFGSAGLLLALYRLGVRFRQWRMATAERHVPELERVIARANLRHSALRAAKLVVAVRLVTLALVTPASVPLGDAVALSLLAIMGLLLCDLTWDEFDALRGRRALDREVMVTAVWDGSERRRRR